MKGRLIYLNQTPSQRTLVIDDLFEDIAGCTAWRTDVQVAESVGAIS